MFKKTISIFLNFKIWILAYTKIVNKQIITHTL